MGKPQNEITEKQKGGEAANGEKPPLFSSWNQLYGLVLLNLIVLIVLFYIFTVTFS